MKKDFLIKIPAALVLLLGLLVIVGWIFHIPLFISFIPNYINMAFNTALCFCLLGLALLLPVSSPNFHQYSQIFLGACVVIFATLTLSQDIFNYSLGIDQFFMKVWLSDLNPFPGRMARNTGIAFIASGLTLILLPFTRKKLIGTIVQVLIFTILALGLSAFIGYLLKLEFLYEWYRFTRMAVPTTLGFILLGISLWLAWGDTKAYQAYYQYNEDKKILSVAMVILLAVALTAGLAGFAISKIDSESLITKLLQQTLQINKNIFTQLTQQALLDARKLQYSVAINQVLSQPTEENKKALSYLIASGEYSSIQIYNNQHQLITAIGQPLTNVSFNVPINLPYKATLLWQGVPYLRFSVPIFNMQKNTLGYFVSEQPLNAVAQLFKRLDFGETGEMAVCASYKDSYATCLPTNRNLTAFTVPLKEKNQIRPMWHALNGESGIVIAEDYRHQKVIAAYSPIDKLGLGIVTKIDTAEVYSPIKSQLQTIIPLVLLAIILGLVLLYWQVLPLIRRIISSEQRLLASETYLQTIINNIADGVIIINKQGVIESVNPKLLEIFAYQLDEIKGKNIMMLMPTHLRPQHKAGMQRYLSTGQPHVVGKGSVELEAIRSSGEKFPIELAVNDVKVDGQHLFVGILKDISARKAEEAKLYESETRFRSAFDFAAIGMAMVSLKGYWLKVNEALCHIVGYSQEELLKLTFQEITYLEDLDKDTKYVQKLIDGELAYYDIEKRYIHKNGSLVWVLLNVSLIKNKQNKPLYFISQIQNITDRKQAEEQLRAMAYSDALTGLANRVQFENNLRIAIAAAERYKKRISVFYIDLDNFKNINDTLGHDAGDQLLQAVARRLKMCVRNTDTVARIGGDEFVLLITELDGDIAFVTMIAQKIINEITKPIGLKNNDLTITTSIGIGLYPEDGINVESLLKNADIALYQAKLQGRNNYQFCTGKMTLQAKEQIAKEKALREALANKELLLHYQPIIDINTKQVTCVEALLRWNSPEFGMISSLDIIPLAEKTGLIYSIGEWSLNMACKQINTWQAAGLTGLSICMNISSKKFKHAQFIDMVTSVLKSHSVPPNSLEFQIAESLIVDSPEKSLVILQTLDKLGIKISIDNFGKGYTSISYLKKLPISKINIDGQLISRILVEPVYDDIVKAIIAMAYQLNISVRAQGVESIEQWQVLKGYGCNEIQGYYVSVPLAIEQITEFLKRYPDGTHSA